MRPTRVLAALALTMIGLVGTAGVAAAGQGFSQACGDGVGTHEVRVLTSPVTVGIELYRPPAATSGQLFILCYSTTPYGAPGGIVGGWVTVSYDVSGTLTNPAASVALGCAPDAGTAFSCGPTTLAGVAVADLPQVSTPSTGLCLVNVNGTCRVTAPGLKVATGGSPAPLLNVTIVGVSVPVDSPVQCVAIVVACP